MYLLICLNPGLQTVRPSALLMSYVLFDKILKWATISSWATTSPFATSTEMSYHIPMSHLNWNELPHPYEPPQLKWATTYPWKPPRPPWATKSLWVKWWICGWWLQVPKNLLFRAQYFSLIFYALEIEWRKTFGPACNLCVQLTGRYRQHREKYVFHQKFSI